MSIKDPPKELLKFGTKKPDKHSQAHLLLETAKACYIMSRPILILRCLWYFPASIFVMHHSLESFIKAFLLRENIDYKTGQNGHKLSYLIELGATESSNLKFFKEITEDDVIKDLFLSLDNSYLTNKYWEVGFNAKTDPLVDVFDKVVSIFTVQFHQLYGDKRKEASIDVPEELADLIERNRKYPTTLCIYPKYEK